MNTEPVAIVSSITAAITATLAILLFVGVDPDLVGAITLAVTGLVGVAAAIVRSRVTPTGSPVADEGRIDLFDLLIVVAVVIVALFVYVSFVQ